MRFGRALAAVALVLVAAAPQDVANRVARDIMSPFCPGVTLHDCPSGEADELRRDITAMAEAGMNEEEIIAELEAEYGPGIAAAPDGPLARALPWVLALGGLVVGWALISRFTTRGRAASAQPGAISAGDRTRLDAEFETFKRNEFGSDA
ncbi:MAG TPA: cytochrome c-type biogenesis protein CcmH [Actinomycetota bacterium]|nr:cytochrome c-type biogenesis protein CcmH [Actinomycetota bacterium]